MTKQLPVNLSSIQHGFTSEDCAQSTLAHDLIDLTRNVTATVTTGAALSPCGGGYVRVLGAAFSLGDRTGKAFVMDCARHTEGLRTDRELKETWGLDEQGWARLAENIPLLNAIKAERERRIHCGEAAREAAQRHFVHAPSVLNEILHNKLISPRHRIEAARELRQVAVNGPETTRATEKFVINIDLGGGDKFVCETEIINRPPGMEDDEW
jgi:hypothetical protein